MTGILETMQAELAEAKAAVVTLTERAILAAQRAEAAEARAETAKAASIAVLDRVERLERVGSAIAELWAGAAHPTIDPVPVEAIDAMLAERIETAPVAEPPVLTPEPEPEPEPPVDAYEAEVVITRKPIPALEPDAFTAEEDMKILLGARANLPADEIAFKIERPEKEVAERLEVLCPKPRNAAKLSKAMLEVRRRKLSGEAA